VLPDQVDTVIAWATVALVMVTGILAIATIVLAVATIAMARNQSQELDVLRKQVDVTREQVRPHLELRNPTWPSPGELPSVTVDYVSGFEAASDEWWAAVTWLAADKRRHCWMYIQRVHHVQIEERVLEQLGDGGTQRPHRKRAS
jgi:hypothetical protein